MKLYWLAIFLLLTACSNSKVMAPIGSEQQTNRGIVSNAWVEPSGPVYRVQRGDTLYGISFSYGMDYRELARINGIREPYTIYVGQPLRVVGTPSTTTRPSQPPAAKPTTTTQPSRPASQPSKPATPPKPPTPPVNAQPATPPTQVTRAAAPLPPTSQGLSWRWPVQGPILSTYSEGSALRKGINIGGNRGQAIVAAAPGRVVYSGNGLPRYGNLLIIKHNDMYLSAYAHNDTLLVKEGDAVDAGQRVATLGSTGTQRNQLHFEIRRNGNPVDPMRFLPKQ